MEFPWLALGASGAAAIAWGFAALTRRYDVAAILGAGAVLFLHAILYFDYTSDDAYISYRYALNFSRGLGLVWNPGEHVEGYSNFLWTVLLAGFDRAGADLVTSGRWLGFALGIVVAGGTYALTRTLLPGEAGRPAGLAAALLLAAAGSFAIWASAGLEVTLFSTLILAGVLLHVHEQARPAVPASAVAWAAVAMTRPDGVLFFGVSGLAKLVEAYARARGEGGRRRLVREALSLAAYAGAFAAIFGGYFAWRYITYDWLLPNTYYAKVGEGLDQYDRGLRYTATFLREYAAWLIVLGPVAIALAPVRRGAMAYVLALLVAWTVYVILVGGDSLVGFRFFAPLLPAVYAVIVAALGGLVQAVRLERPPPRGALWGALGLAFAGFFAVTLHSSAAGFGAGGIRTERTAVDRRVELGRWLRDNVPGDTTIAVIAAGAVPYESGLPAIDMLGISDEHIAHRDVEIGTMAAGHEKYDSEYVLDREPDIIVLTEVRTASPWARKDYDSLRGVIIPAVADMVTNERLWWAYEARGVEIAEGAWFNLLVRRGESELLAKTESATTAGP